MREIVLDTETTGFEPEEGHRLVEIGCVEIVNQIPTGNVYHQYINPERDVPEEAAAVHGLTTERLKDEPVFSEIFPDFLDFIGESKMVIHNAAFDMKFLNAELKMVGHPGLSMKRAVDTLKIARERFPGSPANLDALCRRFGIDNSNRTFHGALLDSELLAEVYLELMGGRQRGLILSDSNNVADSQNEKTVSVEENVKRPFREPRLFPPSPEERAAHKAMLAALSDPVWRDDDTI